MKDILCKIFSFFKYILFVVSFGLVFYCIMVTFGRLEKPLTDGIDVFIPFVFVLIVFIINMLVKKNSASNSLLFNFVSVFVFLVTILVCLRSMFDTNMILYYRYNIDFNPSFFADNISAITSMLYMLGGANVIMIICDIINKPKKLKKEESEKEYLKKEEKKDNEKKKSKD